MWGAEAGRWRDGRGRRFRVAAEADILARWTRTDLAVAHRDHDTSNNADASLAAFCQRGHMIHAGPEDRRRRTLFGRNALGDVFGGPYPPSGFTGCYGSSLSATPRSATNACCRPSSVSILNHRRRHSSVLAASPAGGFSAKNRSTGTPRASASRCSVAQSGSSNFLMSSAKP